jgi:hypothetical protein
MEHRVQPQVPEVIAMDLVEGMRSQFEKAKKWWRRALLANVALCAFAGAAVFASQPPWPLALALVGFALQAGAFVARELSRSRYSVGEEVRRASLFQDGLGVGPSPGQMSRLAEQVGGATHSEPPYLGPYYASERAKGAERLCDILAEAAFFTSRLARTSSLFLGGMAFLGLLVAAGGIFFAVSLAPSPTTMMWAARIVVTVLPFWAVGDLSRGAVRYYRLSVAAERTFDRCDWHLGAEVSRDDALLLADTYNCALAGAPPILTCVYRWRQKRLNDAWRRARGSRAPNAVQSHTGHTEGGRP